MAGIVFAKSQNINIDENDKRPLIQILLEAQMEARESARKLHEKMFPKEKETEEQKERRKKEREEYWAELDKKYPYNPDKCDFCQPRNFNLDEEDGKYFIKTDYSDGYGFEYEEIFYCPKCGKKLNE